MPTNEVNVENIEEFTVTVETVDRTGKEQRVDSHTLELRPGDPRRSCDVGGLTVCVSRGDRAGRWTVSVLNVLPGRPA